MINVRMAELEDAEKIAEIGVRTWKHSYCTLLPDQLLRGRSVDQSRITKEKYKILADEVWVVSDDGEIIGYLWGGRSRDGEVSPADYEVRAIYVLPEAQGKGAGKLLLKAFAEHIGQASFYLYALKGNPSVGFYYKCGAKRVLEYDRILNVDGVKVFEETYLFDDFSLE